MEACHGSLAHHRVELLIPALYEGARVRGRLRLERGPIRREFEILDGALVAERTNQPREHLAQLLANLEVLDAGRAAAAFEAAEAVKLPYGTFLVERGFVDRERLREVLEHKAQEAFFDCYGWQSGTFEFLPGEPSRASQGVHFALPLMSLHREALARRREWRAFDAAFPHKHQHFELSRELTGLTREEVALAELARRGATLEELLSSSPDGRLAAARRIQSLFRREYLFPVPVQAAPAPEELNLVETLTLARALLYDGRFEESAALTSGVLERAPVPEAQRLFDEAEAQLAGTASRAIATLTEALRLSPSPLALPKELTADDLYVLSKLRQARTPGEALRSAAMGELAAYRSMKRLKDAGLLEVEDPPENGPH